MTDETQKPLDEVTKSTINQAIEDAEKCTNAEIVVAISAKSGHYERAEDLVGLVIALVTVATVSLSMIGAPEPGSWGSNMASPLGLGALLVLFAVSAIIGTMIASRAPGLVRIFVPNAVMMDRVERRGAEAFYMCRMRQTAHEEGLLIFVSLFERRCWIMGDDGVQSHFDETTWDAARDQIVEGFKNNDPASGLRKAIETTGNLLAEALPKTGKDRDELPNRVHLIP